MSAKSPNPVSPVGTPTTEAAARRTSRPAYRDAKAEYAAIEALRKDHPVAAHLRERRFELGLTQAEVAEAAGTSHSYISRLEQGHQVPSIQVLRRVLAVLDEDLVLVFESKTEDGVERQEAALPPLVAA